MTMTTQPTLTQVSTTYVGQLNKPANRIILEGYRNSKDRSPETFAHYYFEIIEMLYHTPAWGRPKTNLMINDLTAKVRASLAGAKKGKSSASAHAGTLLSTIDWCAKTPAAGTRWFPVALDPLLSREEVDSMLKFCAA